MTDIVLYWVDGADPAWQAEWRKARTRAGIDDDASLIRYRDWGTLRYWFRAIEQFAPWVRRVHLVTWGHVPEWLSLNHPKLRVVRHKAFIPAEYLPAFSSHPIELNLHRIEDLAEQFIVFNDDTFLLRPCKEADFFRKGLPADMARLSIVQPSSIGHIVYNNLELINARYRKHLTPKWFSLKYGLSNLLKTLSLMPWDTFSGFADPHQCQPFLRSQIERCWQQWPEKLDATCRRPFRNLRDVSAWLFRYDALATDRFTPRSMRDTRLYTLADNSLSEICEDIARQRYRLICLNDGPEIADFEAASTRLAAAFERVLPQKSAYEK